MPSSLHNTISSCITLCSGGLCWVTMIFQMSIMVAWRFLKQYCLRARCSRAFSSGINPWPLCTKISQYFHTTFHSIMNCRWWNTSILCNFALRNIVFKLTDNSLTMFGTKWWTMTFFQSSFATVPTIFVGVATFCCFYIHKIQLGLSVVKRQAATPPLPFLKFSPALKHLQTPSPQSALTLISCGQSGGIYKRPARADFSAELLITQPRVIMVI